MNWMQMDNGMWKNTETGQWSDTPDSTYMGSGEGVAPNVTLASMPQPWVNPQTGQIEGYFIPHGTGGVGEGGAILPLTSAATTALMQQYPGVSFATPEQRTALNTSSTSGGLGGLLDSFVPDNLLGAALFAASMLGTAGGIDNLLSGTNALMGSAASGGITAADLLSGMGGPELAALNSTQQTAVLNAVATGADRATLTNLLVQGGLSASNASKAAANLLSVTSPSVNPLAAIMGSVGQGLGAMGQNISTGLGDLFKAITNMSDKMPDNNFWNDLSTQWEGALADVSKQNASLGSIMQGGFSDLLQQLQDQSQLDLQGLGDLGAQFGNQLSTLSQDMSHQLDNLAQSLSQVTGQSFESMRHMLEQQNAQSVQNLMTGFNEIGGQIGNVGADITGSIDSLAQQLAAATGESFDQVKQMLLAQTAQADLFSQGITDLGAQFNNFTEQFSGYQDSVKSALSGGLDQIANMQGAQWDKFLEELTKQAELDRAALGDLGAQFGNQIGDLGLRFDDLLSGLDTNFDDLMAQLTKQAELDLAGMGDLGAQFNNSMGNLATQFDDFTSQFGSNWDQFMKDLQDQADRDLQGLGDLGAQFGNQIGDLGLNISNEFGNLGSLFTTGLSNLGTGVGNLGNLFSGAIGGLGDLFTNLFGKMNNTALWSDLLGAVLGYKGHEQAAETAKALMDKAIEADRYRFEPFWGLAKTAATDGLGNTTYGRSIADAVKAKQSSLGFNVSGNMAHEIAQGLNKGMPDYMQSIAPYAIPNFSAGNNVRAFGNSLINSQLNQIGNIGYGLGTIFDTMMKPVSTASTTSNAINSMYGVHGTP